ncbi:MAG TPA: acetyl-CoA carboxylase biotin carboxyl carrier protein [Candidatus Anaerobutyricum avicola]|nr:acetyl-CoA carboxylase biotin carboxyl carrier protein [Candidatus Anaerobutyricum avicola]
MQYEEILKLVKGVSEAGLTNFEYTEGNIRIVMSCPEHKGPAPAPVVSVQEGDMHMEIPAPQPAPVQPEAAAAQAAPAADDQSGNIVKCPLVGTFYEAPSEDAPAFVKVGDTVKKGQTLGIVEAMKLMNEIESEFDGVVKEIYVQNEESVEYGQPLFRIG